MLKIATIVLGLMNILLFAPFLITTAVQNPMAETFTLTFALAGFIAMTGVLLLWAARDMSTRAPVLFWNALVRILAACANVYAIQINLIDASQYAFAIFDFSAAIILIVAALKSSQRSFLNLLFLRVA